MTPLPYATCRALKEAGFPQNCAKGISMAGPDGYEHFAIPDLSELIAWCGGKFYRLEKMAEGWEVRGTRFDHVDTHREWGPTPEAAVAALYLATHGKENV